MLNPLISCQFSVKHILKCQTHGIKDRLIFESGFKNLILCSLFGCVGQYRLPLSDFTHSCTMIVHITWRSDVTTNLYFYTYNFGSFSKTINFSQKSSNPHNPPKLLHHCWTGIPVLPPSHLTNQPTSAIQRQINAAAGARLEEVAWRCQELPFMITEQEPALEFILLHIYYYIFISDFWAKGLRVYRSTNQV